MPRTTDDSSASLIQFIRFCFRHLGKYPIEMIGILMAIIAAQTTILFVPLLWRRLINALIQANPSTVESVGYFVVIFVLPIAGFRFLSWSFWRISGFFAGSLQPKVMRDLTDLAFHRLMEQSYRFFSDSFSGSLVRKVKSLSQSFREVIDAFWWNVTPMIVSVIGGLILLGSRVPVLGVVVLIWIVGLTVSNIRVGRSKGEADEARAAKDTQVTGILADNISNYMNIALFTSQHLEESNLHRHVDEWRSLFRRAWYLREVGLIYQSVINILLEIGVMTIVVLQWKNGLLSVGDVVFVQGLLLVLFNTTHDIGRIFRRMFDASADAKEIMEILSMRPEVRDVRGAKELSITRGMIEFQRVDFQYHERMLFTNFSLRIKPKEKVALVGSSGSGKTTLTKLLFRFFDIQDGSILIDGQNIAKVSQESLRSAIALVPQESILFHRSLMENIRYGRRDATDEEVIEAAKYAHCHEFISSLPQGYATLVGERGVKLSGGERQRVAIARAILKNAPILVLDEATSSLDSESEMLIQDALRRLMKDKTVIVIAHRLSTINQMDRIVVLEQGKIVDEGTHDGLLKKAGIYQKLWNIQAGGFST